MFKPVCKEAGIGDSWTPRELRTSSMCVSHRGVSIEEIARLVGHSSTRTTEIVHRELRPVITTGAEIWMRSSVLGVRSSRSRGSRCRAV